jgi:hypothetical protein
MAPNQPQTRSGLTSQLGHSRPNWTVRAMSGTLIATELRTTLEVRFVPGTNDDNVLVNRVSYIRTGKFVLSLMVC